MAKRLFSVIGSSEIHFLDAVALGMSTIKIEPIRVELLALIIRLDMAGTSS